MLYWFLRAIAECFARLSHGLGVCSFVCPFVTLLYCVKTVQAKITKFLPCAATRSLVFRDKISCLWIQGFHSNESIKERYLPLKDVTLPLLARLVWKRLQIGTEMLLIITSTGDKLFRFINIDDLERPWLPKVVLVNFSQFLDAAHISTLNCDEMAGDKPRQPAYEIFSTKGKFQQSKSWPPMFKKTGAGGRQRRLPPKKWLFYRYWVV